MNNENIATTNEGITVKREKTEMYFKLVCAPFLFFFLYNKTYKNF